MNEEDVIAIHRMRHLFVRYVENLPSEELPDLDLVLKSSSIIKPFFANSREAAKENLAKFNKQPDIVQLNFQMLEDTLLAYVTVSMKYAEEIRRLKSIRVEDIPIPATKGRKRAKIKQVLTMADYVTSGI